MRGGYARMVGGPVRLSDMDLEESREHRSAVHAAVRERDRLVLCVIEPVQSDEQALAAGRDFVDNSATELPPHEP